MLWKFLPFIGIFVKVLMDFEVLLKLLFHHLVEVLDGVVKSIIFKGPCA